MDDPIAIWPPAPEGRVSLHPNPLPVRGGGRTRVIAFLIVLLNVPGLVQHIVDEFNHQVLRSPSPSLNRLEDAIEPNGFWAVLLNAGVPLLTLVFGLRAWRLWTGKLALLFALAYLFVYFVAPGVFDRWKPFILSHLPR